MPGGEIYKQVFAASPYPVYQEISQRLVIAKDYDDYEEMMLKVISTGLFAEIGTTPFAYEEDFKDWYRSSEIIPGPWIEYQVHLTNKKWPLKKVKKSS